MVSLGAGPTVAVLTLSFMVPIRSLSLRISRAVGRASPGPFCSKKALVYFPFLPMWLLIRGFAIMVAVSK